MADKTPVSQSQKPVKAQPQAKCKKHDSTTEGKQAGKAKAQQQKGEQNEEMREACCADAAQEQQK